MRSSRIIRILAGTVVILLLMNALLTWVLEPATSSSSDNMWYGYQNREEIDTIFVGSSLVSRSLDPDAYDAIMGTHSYNMGTNAQMFAQSYTAIETAWREHQVQTVILGIGYFEFQMRQGIGNEVAFYRARNHYSTLSERIRNDLRYVFSEDNYEGAVSINYFFPWVYDHVTVDAESILANVQEKASAENKDAGEPGNGFSNGDDTVLDFNTLSYEDTCSAAAQKEVAPAYDELARICSFCKEHAIDLYVVNMPLPQYYVVAFPEQYYERADRIRQTCEENGFAYYDFNVARPELFTCDDAYYMDYEHMNQTGSEAFTKAVANLVTAVQGGTDVSSWFYDQDSYLASIDRIVCTNYTYDWNEDGSLTVTGYAYCGTGVEPEYQFSVWDETSGAYTVLQEYSASNILTLDADGVDTLKDNGNIKIRIDARDGNHPDTANRYYEDAIS